MKQKNGFLKFFGYVASLFITFYLFDIIRKNLMGLILVPIWLLLIWVIYKKFIKGDKNIWPKK